MAAEDQEKLDSVAESARVLKNAIEKDLKPTRCPQSLRVTFPAGTNLADGLERGDNVLVFAFPLSGLDCAGVARASIRLRTSVRRRARNCGLSPSFRFLPTRS